MRQVTGLVLTGVLIALLAPMPAEAGASRTQELNTSALPLGDALKTVAHRFDLKIAFFSNDTRGWTRQP